MFDEFTGLPLHPLVVHAVVVLVPMTVLVGLGFVLVPPWRWLLRWPLVVLALSSLGSSYVATQSGEAFIARVPALERIVAEHQEQGELLFRVLIVLAVVSVVAAWALGGTSPLRSHRGARAGSPRLVQFVVGALLLVACAGAGVQVVRAGDSGSRAVWGSTLAGSS